MVPYSILLIAIALEIIQKQQNIISIQMDRELELFSFFSSYLNDMVYLIHKLKQIVYKIINIQDIFKPITPTYADLNSIVFSCNKSHDDLRQVESMLRGYASVKVQVNETSNALNHSMLLLRQSRNSRSSDSQLNLQNQALIEQEYLKTQSTDYKQKKRNKSFKKKDTQNTLRSLFFKRQIGKDHQQLKQTSQTNSKQHHIDTINDLPGAAQESVDHDQRISIRRTISLNSESSNRQEVHPEETNRNESPVKVSSKQLGQSKSTGFLDSLQYVKLIRLQLNISTRQ